MNIAILNESFLQESHLNTLRSLGDVTIYENTDNEERAIERLKGADIAIADCFIAPLNRNVFENSPSLKLLCINSTGFDFVDTVAAKEKGIAVAHVPGFSTEAVAEHIFALILAVNKKIVLGDVAMRKSPFQIDPANAEQKRFMGMNLLGKTLGVIGLGSIGTRVAQIGLGFGMSVVATNRSVKEVGGVKLVLLQELLEQSDVVALTVPFTTETENLLSAKEIARLKPNAILVNITRGKCIDEAALIDALKEKKISGAGLDVVTDWSIENPLLLLENVVLSPHSAFFTQESLDNCADIIVGNVRAFITGQPVNIVNQ